MKNPDRNSIMIYRDIMINQRNPWVEISGNYEERVQQAITAVDGLIMQP